MKSITLFGLTAVGAAGIYFVVTAILSYIQDANFIKAHGCKAPRRLPQRDPVIGYGLFKKRRLNWKAKQIFQEQVERADELGPTFSGWIFGTKFIQTTDPENVKTVLSTNFKDYGIGRRKATLGELLGDGIFTSDGVQWEHSRALIKPAFAKSQVSELENFETHIQDLIQQIPKDGSTFDLQPFFFKLTLDTATSYLFGESVGSLRNPNDPFGKAFDDAQVEMVWRDQLGPLSFFYRSKTLDANCKIVHSRVDKLVHRCLDYRKSRDEKPEDVDEKNEKYVFLNELAKATQDPRQLRDELMNMLLAGRDTTAGLLAHIFFYLARRPDVFQKLRTEVDQLKGELPDYETLKNMKYLRYLLNESLRLHPALPSNGRFPNKNTTLPRGGGPDGLSPVFIGSKTVVVYSSYAMHRNKAVYGEDAEEFNPDRWETLRVGWDYIPFNGGPRICVGQQFALTEAGYTTVRLMQHFDIENKDPGKYEEAYTLTNQVGCGVKVAITPRK